jgi:hypothetical protein
MSELDYYTIMESRIRFLAKKYDPHNKFPVEWQKKREEQDKILGENLSPEQEEKKSLKKKRQQFAEAMYSFVSILF